MNLEQKVKEWKKERRCDHFMFRGYGEALQDPVPNSAFEEDEVKLVESRQSKSCFLSTNQLGKRNFLQNMETTFARCNISHNTICLAFVFYCG